MSQMTGAAPGVSFASWAAVAGRAAERWAAGFVARGTFSTYGDFECVRPAAGRGFDTRFGTGVTGEGVAAGASPAEPPPTDGSAAAGAGSCPAAAEP